MQAVKNKLPQVRQDFIHSRHRLDLLVDSAFGQNQASAFNNAWRSAPHDADWLENWSISFLAPMQDHPFNRESVRFDEWHTIEWLSSGEQDAIIFLASSPQILHHFTSLYIPRQYRSFTLRADIHLSYLNYASLYIFRGQSDMLPIGLHHHEYLGDGYYIYIYYRTPGVSLIPLWTFLGRVFFVMASIMFAFGVIGVFLLIRDRMQSSPSS